MQTVNRVLFEPKRDCFACKNGECSILTETYCRRSKKCNFYKTEIDHALSLKKANARLEKLGLDVSKYKTQKNNRVSGN